MTRIEVRKMSLLSLILSSTLISSSSYAANCRNLMAADLHEPKSVEKVGNQVAEALQIDALCTLPPTTNGPLIVLIRDLKNVNLAVDILERIRKKDPEKARKIFEELRPKLTTLVNGSEYTRLSGAAFGFPVRPSTAAASKPVMKSIAGPPGGAPVARTKSEIRREALRPGMIADQFVIHAKGSACAKPICLMTVMVSPEYTQQSQQKVLDLRLEELQKENRNAREEFLRIYNQKMSAIKPTLLKVPRPKAHELSVQAYQEVREQILRKYGVPLNVGPADMRYLSLQNESGPRFLPKWEFSEISYKKLLACSAVLEGSEWNCPKEIKKCAEERSHSIGFSAMDDYVKINGCPVTVCAQLMLGGSLRAGIGNHGAKDPCTGITRELYPETDLDIFLHAGGSSSSDGVKAGNPVERD